MHDKLKVNIIAIKYVGKQVKLPMVLTVITVSQIMIIMALIHYW